jgi:hypothetical protein
MEIQIPDGDRAAELIQNVAPSELPGIPAAFVQVKCPASIMPGTQA